MSLSDVSLHSVLSLILFTTMIAGVALLCWLKWGFDRDLVDLFHVSFQMFSGYITLALATFDHSRWFWLALLISSMF